MKWRNPTCDSEDCPGYFINGETLAVERCDTCKLFKSDDAAAVVVETLAKLGLDALVRRPRTELEAAAVLGPLLVAMTCSAPSPDTEIPKNGACP
jgi:hypothetical protein